MTFRETIEAIIAGDGTNEEKSRLICGFLRCECGIDNGNGLYDDDDDMSEDGLGEAEEAWLAGKDAYR